MLPVIIPVAIAAAGAAAGVALGVTTVIAAAISVGVTALAAGASYLMRPSTQPRTQGQQLSAAPANEQRSVPVAQAVPPRRFVYGRVRTGGALFFQDNNNPFLYIGCALSDGVIEGVDATYIGDEIVPVDGSGNATSATRWGGKLTRTFTTGEADQTASSLLVDAFPLLIDSSFRQRGVARAVARMDYGADAEEHNFLWGSSVSPSFLIKGLRVYDPRDSAQSLSDPSTWKFSSNPALCVAHALTHAWGVALPTTVIDYEALAAAADICDAPIIYNGESVPTFSMGGIFQGDVDFGQQIEEMLGAFRGRLNLQDGKFAIVADAPRSPVWTVQDLDILEIGEYQFATDARNLFNAISANYYDSNDAGRRSTTPPFELGPEIAAEGLRETSVNLPFTDQASSAQIIAFRELMQARDGRALTLRLIDAALYLSPSDIIEISTTFAPFLNGQFEVIQVDLADVGVMVTLRGYSAAVYADPSTYLV
jgi:hypothetical protein